MNRNLYASRLLNLEVRSAFKSDYRPSVSLFIYDIFLIQMGDDKMKWSTIFFPLLVFLFSCSSEEQEGINWDYFHGVWANENCELIRTANYSLLFERDGSIISSNLQRVTVEVTRINFNTRAKAVFNNSDSTVLLKAKYLFEKDEVVIQHPISNELLLTNKSYSIKKESGKLLLLENDHLVEELDIKNKTIKMKCADDRWETLFLIEKIEMSEPYDMPKNVTKDNIGQRIQEWQLGTSYWKIPNSVFWKIDIGTNKHLYTFTMNTDFLYCRAARLRSNNQGSVFAQNIRLTVWGEKRNERYVGYMAEDNLKASGSELEIDNSKFNSQCGIAYDVDIYWSLNSFKDGEIKVNGCDKVYFRIPANKDDDRMLEWIAFEKY